MLTFLSELPQVLLYSTIGHIWWLFVLITWRASKKDYDLKRDRRQAIERHYTEEHDTPLRECRVNMCAIIN